MTIYTGGGSKRRGKYLEDFRATTGEVLGAAAKAAWRYGPASSLYRMGEMADAARGEFLPAEVARARLEKEGLADRLEIPEVGIHAPQLELLIERKREEMDVQDVFNRAPNTFSSHALRFGVSLAVGMADPINLASAFIPVVGPVRYANMLRRAASPLARLGVRARVGAAEGLVGQALVEPLVYAAAQKEQADYTLTDSALAVGFGAILGPAVHVTGGALSDAFKAGARAARADIDAPTPRVAPDSLTERNPHALAERLAAMHPKDRADTLRVAVAQAVSGRRVEVADLVRFVEAKERITPTTTATARRQVVEALTPTMREELIPEAGNRMSKGDRQALERQVKDIEYRLAHAQDSFKETIARVRQTEGKTNLQAKKTARTLGDVEKKSLAETLGRLRARLAADDVARRAHADLSRLGQGIVPERFKQRVEDATMERFDAAQARHPDEVLSTASPESVRATREAWDGMRRTLEENHRPEMSRLSDLKLADEISEQVAAAKDKGLTIDDLKAELADELDRLNETARIVGEDVSDIAKALGEQVHHAERMARGMRALALCQLTKG